MSGKAAKRGRFFGRRQRRPIEAAERPQDAEEELPNPMRREDWVRWLELQRELELRGESRLLKFHARVPIALCVPLRSHRHHSRSDRWHYCRSRISNFALARKLADLRILRAYISAKRGIFGKMEQAEDVSSNWFG